MSNHTYISYFKEFFSKIQDEFDKSIHFKDESDLSHTILAFRRAIYAFPCPIRVLKLNVDTNKHTNAKNEIYHLVLFDFTKFGKSVVNYYGQIKLEDIQGHQSLLQKFYFEEEDIKLIKGLEKLSFISYDPWILVELIPYDIISEPNKYVSEFLESFKSRFYGNIIENFDVTINFDEKYNLKPDPILIDSELLKKSPEFDSFGTSDEFGNNRKITLQDIQREINQIQLIPHVPPEVVRVFNGAKRLFLFGYFEYYFFTVSQHYAYLALESALKNKYRLYGNPKKKLVKIIDELGDKGVISNYYKTIFHTIRRLRNNLSHLTRPPVAMPNSRTLQNIAYYINCLFET